MPVCIFYQQGRCKFGDRCKNEHPGAQSASPFGGGGNRFGVLAGGGFAGAASGGGAFGGGPKDIIKDNKYGLNPDDIRTDLTPGKGRPQWIFTCYGPGKNAPVQLFGGPQREQSFEEMRALHYAAAAAGNAQQAVQDAMKLYAETEAQIQTILNDIEGAVRYIIQGENTHPNRIDIIEGKTGPSPMPFGQSSPFAQASTGPSTATPSPFSQQSTFGKPSFGQPTPFGQPSTVGAAAQPNPFGQPAGPPPFAQLPFSQATQTQANPFSKPSTGSSPFAQIKQPNQQQQPNPFGQPFGQPQPPQQNPFGQPHQQPQTQQQTPNPFGTPQSQNASTVGQPSLSPFASKTPVQPTNQQSPFSTAPPPTSTTATLPQKAKPHLNPFPALHGETRRDPGTNRLLSWKGQAVKYIDNEPCYQHPNDAGTFVRIYFPDGPPKPETLRDAEAKTEEYTAETEAIYRFVREHGGFGIGGFGIGGGEASNMKFIDAGDCYGANLDVLGSSLLFSIYLTGGSILSDITKASVMQNQE
ncbi:CCCH zinc finger domain-containing protein [Histoplasma capsulatum var. duboisii H88]|uniref:CCCH zinc finger domain-containing protein n=1 Tax=Ajellomyces capsulatus (strain H88) TaxID=544711 RepID=F0UFM1_AJEC8|nr:CCCH zinc finger domain-containing protein [Histoplasma capsulatum var. duboisii H88]